ncbi:MAG TPA: GNAT family N-acetyltransferase [Bacteroidetes bacterium]|nr:GNAT family N-acetyltransferase [Bacteroidota bacterium]
MVEIRAFDGDLQEVSDLIKASWAEDYQGAYKQPVMDYSSIDFLKWNLKRPNSDPDLLVGAYDGIKLVAFAAGFPHQTRYNDKVFKSVAASFLTTHTDYKKRGIGKSIGKAFLGGAKKRYDIVTCVPDEGHAVERALENLSHTMNVGFLKLHRFTFLSKPLDKKKLLELADLPLYQKIGMQLFTKKTSAVKREIYEVESEKDIRSIYQMLNSSYHPNTLAVNWDEDMLATRLRSRISNSLYINRNGRKGFINYYNMALIGCRSTPKVHKITMIDNVQFENMSFFEKHRFISDFCASQKKHGSCIINIPTSPAFDLTPFYSNTFLPSGRYHSYCVQDLHSKLGDNVQAGYLFLC